MSLVFVTLILSICVTHLLPPSLATSHEPITKYKSLRTAVGLAEEPVKYHEQGLSESEIVEIDETKPGSSTMPAIIEGRNPIFSPRFKSNEEVTTYENSESWTSAQSSGTSTSVLPLDLSPRRSVRLQLKNKLKSQQLTKPIQAVPAKIQSFLQSLTSSSQAFDSPLKRLSSFSRLRMMNKDQLDQELDSILSRIFSSRRKIRKYIRVTHYKEEEDQDFIKQRLKQDFNQFRLFAEDATVIKNTMHARSQKILSSLQAILDPSESGSSSDPLARICTKMGKHKFKKLLHDQEGMYRFFFLKIFIIVLEYV
ncbi:hypothetical protein PGTUg99_025179 [Puccinia graminis f. sp. tritici]|uniref:Uncharacterized protein n=1 Tax=Puccinia graminis f. sp. tritici TaxID=56615 RepID=A0A5B0MZB3_PUCGR|nr:hypothetical protein PGTUg99_025179 [Puccinia graminis f. sp. tritici]